MPWKKILFCVCVRKEVKFIVIIGRALWRLPPVLIFQETRPNRGHFSANYRTEKSSSRVPTSSSIDIEIRWLKRGHVRITESEFLGNLFLGAKCIEVTLFPDYKAVINHSLFKYLEC